MDRTTIAIREETRDRIKAAAAAESQTIDAFLRTLLDEREEAQFWASFEDLTPADYAAATQADGDELDEGFSIEDQTLGADQ